MQYPEIISKADEKKTNKLEIKISNNYFLIL